jgi:hypothetical protein
MTWYSICDCFIYVDGQIIDDMGIWVLINSRVHYFDSKEMVVLI